ncbi:unnamed protein product [Toxocara canis]|uniref:Increased recombination centers protein 6 n=1 Tax=Toxocara canis TaxID=6265 RepID=A0A183UCT8_TOXCA|nr:unnamed protein product [Toxocara canis]
MENTGGAENGPAVALLIADRDRTILDALIGEKSGSRGDTKTQMLIDNKYYTATVYVHSFEDVRSALVWDADNVNAEIGAIIFQFEGVVESLDELKKGIDLWQADVQVMVCDRLERGAEWSEVLLNFCVMEEFELIELHPDEVSYSDTTEYKLFQETLLQLQEYAELHGIARIRQVLESAKWAGKVMKENPYNLVNLACRVMKKSVDEEAVSEEDCRLIEQMFGGPRQSLSDVYKDVPDVDEDVLAYLKQEINNSETAPNKQSSTYTKKKKKKTKTTKSEDEFGEFMSAESSMTKKESNGSDQVPSGLEGSIETSEVEENAVCSHSNEVQPPNAQSKDGEAPNHELSELAKSMIDGLFGKDANVAKHSEVSDVATKFDQVRCALSKMSFGADRQNLAADTMIEMIKTLGAEDLFASSSEEEA